MNFDENHVTNEYHEGNEKVKALNYGNLNFGDVYKDVKNTLEEARSKAYSSINFYMVKAYWQIGKIINEAQDGNKRAEYGRELINELSKYMLYIPTEEELKMEIKKGRERDLRLSFAYEKYLKIISGYN